MAAGGTVWHGSFAPIKNRSWRLPKLDDSMHRAWSMGAGSLDGDSTVCSLELAAWMLMAMMMMRVGMRMLMNDDQDESWEGF